MTEKMIMKMAALLGAVAILASCGTGDSGQADNVISRGKAYAMSDVVVPGKVVILEFTASW